MPLTKVCKKCLVEKPLEKFAKMKGCKDGHVNYCKDCNVKRDLAYKLAHPETVERRRELDRGRKKLKEAVEYALNWRRTTPKGIYIRYKAGAKNRRIEFLLTKEQFQMWFNNTACVYCGEHIATIGIDRIDNTKGYTLDNIAFCCAICNVMKNDMSIEEFKTHIIKLSNHIGVSNAA